jgi:hypothetical protein
MLRAGEESLIISINELTFIGAGLNWHPMQSKLNRLSPSVRDSHLSTHDFKLVENRVVEEKSALQSQPINKVEEFNNNKSTILNKTNPSQPDIQHVY